MAEPVKVDAEKAAAEFRRKFERVRAEVAKAIVGHAEIIEGVLTCLFVGGHALLEGVPGLGKTYLIRSLAQALSLDFSRIQFTPDLMPADIIGTNVISEDPTTGRRGFEFQKGPLFGQIILHAVTSSGHRYVLKEPFFVMATQNPIEQEGTYPLPEAQVDRFFYKLLVVYSDKEELKVILDRTTTGHTPDIKPAMSGPEIIGAQNLVKRVVMAPHVQDYALRLVLASHPEGRYAIEATNKYVRWGASPRAAQAVTLGAKVQALLDGRFNTSFLDVQKVYLPAMRHRVLLNFEGEAEGISTDDVLGEIIERTPTMAEAAA